MAFLPFKRFRFGLSWLFIATAVVAVGIGWIVRQRVIVEERRRAIGQLPTVFKRGSGKSFYWAPCDDAEWSDETWSTVPLIWRLLGASPQVQINLDPKQYSEADAERFSNLFPEASIQWDP